MSRSSLLIFRSHVQRSRSNYSFEPSVLSTLYILIPWLLALYRFCFYREDKPEFCTMGGIDVSETFLVLFLYPPRMKFRGVYRNHSVCPSVCLSVCLSVRLSVQIRVRPITMVRCVTYSHELCMTLTFDLNIKIIFSQWIWIWQDVFALWHRLTKFLHMDVSPLDDVSCTFMI